MNFKTIARFSPELKAFYNTLDSQDSSVVLCDDKLIAGVGEITIARRRTHEKEVLLPRLKDEYLLQDDYQWSIDLRNYGTVPHAGFGLVSNVW